VLDEASSNLDVRTERQVAQNLAALKLTVIMVAHRPQTIKMADRIENVYRMQSKQPRHGRQALEVGRPELVVP
jgi:ATP-binding cassette subfamily B protein RaxB